MRQLPESIPVVFPNDPLFKFVSGRVFFSPEEIETARASLIDGRGWVEIQISPAAAKRFNELVRSNCENQESGLFENHVGLGVLVEGQAHQVIQGIFRLLESNTWWWTPADDRLPPDEQLRQAQTMAMKIFASQM
jgi:hypothetical protein